MCVVCQLFQTSSPQKPLGCLKPNFMWDGGTKVCSDGPGHMTKMAAMPIYVRVSRVLTWVHWAASWQNQQSDLCAQQRLRSAWASAQSDQSHRCPHEETLGPQLPIECTTKTDQTGQMPRLIWVFAGRTDHFVGFCHEAAHVHVHSLWGDQQPIGWSSFCGLETKYWLYIYVWCSVERKGAYGNCVRTLTNLSKLTNLPFHRLVHLSQDRWSVQQIGTFSKDRWFIRQIGTSLKGQMIYSPDWYNLSKDRWSIRQIGTSFTGQMFYSTNWYISERTDDLFARLVHLSKDTWSVRQIGTSLKGHMICPLIANVSIDIFLRAK